MDTKSIEQEGGDCSVCGFSKPTPEHFKVGQGVIANWRDRYVVEGKVVKVIEPRVPLTDKELKKFANIVPEDSSYKSVKGENCGMRRLVLQMGLGLDKYAIVPVNANSYKIKIKELHCSFCGKGASMVNSLIAGGPNYSEQKGDKGNPVHICNECIELCQDVIESKMIEGTKNENCMP
jgi:hypothetical protein